MTAPVRPVIIAANWKMNTVPGEAGTLAAAIADATEEPDVVRVICPPYVALAEVRDALAGRQVAVGAQNVHAEPAGAYTGEISAAMLRGLASWVIVGHSERRRDQGETDELINGKLRRCQEHDLRPILCVGEQLPEREAGRAKEIVQRQLRGALQDLPPRDTLVIAYEPVWAIGTGVTARGSDAAAMAETIRRSLGELAWGPVAGAIPVLYGGSVTSATVGEFLDEPAIDGALVGGASLKVDEMAGIVARAALSARARAAAGAGR
jgi:triosephosphate isomerase